MAAVERQNPRIDSKVFFHGSNSTQRYLDAKIMHEYDNIGEYQFFGRNPDWFGRHRDNGNVLSGVARGVAFGAGFFGASLLCDYLSGKQSTTAYNNCCPKLTNPCANIGFMLGGCMPLF